MGFVALGAAVVLPAAMGIWPGAQGVSQRAIFVVAYVWLATEALGGARRGPGDQRGA